MPHRQRIGASDEALAKSGDTSRRPSLNGAGKVASKLWTETEKRNDNSLDAVRENLEHMLEKMAPPPDVQQEKHGWPLDQHWFENFVGFFIVLNAVQMGVARSGTWVDEPGWSVLFKLMEHVFTSIFLIEAIVKLVVQRSRYFCEYFNLLDFFLALLAVVDTWILGFFVTGGDLGGLIALRLLRLVRIVRMFKMLKMRQDMLILIEGMGSSMKSMVPVSLVLMLVIYAMSLVCFDIINEDPDLTDSYKRAFWNTLPTAWQTLFSMVILAEWGDIVWPMWADADIGSFMIPLFAIFVLFGSFGLLNVIIGVICEQTVSAARRYGENAKARGRVTQMRQVAKMIEEIAQLDDDCDGMLSAAELRHPGILDLLGQLELPHGFGPNELHTLLDTDGSGEVGLGEFCESMFRLIYADEFQRICMNLFHFSDIKKIIRSSQLDIQTEIRTMRQELQDTRADLGFKSMVIPVPVEEREKTPDPLEAQMMSQKEQIVYNNTMQIVYNHNSNNTEVSSGYGWPGEGDDVHGNPMIIGIHDADSSTYRHGQQALGYTSPEQNRMPCEASRFGPRSHLQPVQPLGGAGSSRSGLPGSMSARTHTETPRVLSPSSASYQMSRAAGAVAGGALPWTGEAADGMGAMDYGKSGAVDYGVSGPFSGGSLSGGPLSGSRSARNGTGEQALPTGYGGYTVNEQPMPRSASTPASFSSGGPRTARGEPTPSTGRVMTPTSLMGPMSARV